MKRLLMAGFLFSTIFCLMSSCQKELSQEDNSNTGRFSLQDSLDVCYGYTLHGTYYNGVSAERDTNFLAVAVNVTATGSYTVITDSVNGYYFSGSGFFSKTGMDTLILQAHGIPIFVQTNEFSLSDTTTCAYIVDVRDSTGTGLGGVDTTVTPSGDDSSYVDPNPAASNTWHFTDTATGITYSGVFTALEGAGFLGDTLFVAGQATTNIDTLFGLTIEIPSLTVTPGIYPVNASNSIALQTAADQNNFYIANDITASEGEGDSYITITDFSNNQLSASFHAYAEFNGTPTLIVGSFNCFVH